MTVDLRPDTTHWLKILSGDYVIDVAVHQWTVEAPVATAFCLHSFTGNAQDFCFLAAELKSRGITTLAVDMPGRGNSAFLGDGARYTNRLLQLVLAEAIALATAQLILVGTSWGGALIGALTPYIRAKVVGLVLVDAPLVSGSESFYPYEDFLRDEASMSFRSLQSARIYFGLTRNLLHLPPDQLDELVAASIMKSEGQYRMRYDPALANMNGRRAPFNLSKSLGKTGIKTLAVLGSDSHLVQAPAQAAARAALSDLTTYICEHEAHPPSLSRPHHLAHIASFIESCVTPDDPDSA